MRIVMMGTGPFAVPTFQALLESDHEVVALVTRPTRPARGRRGAPINPMKKVADAAGLAVFAPESINEKNALEHLRAWAADLFVVCDYGQILSADALSLSRLGGVNLHGSLLPKYRGAAPVQWAVYHGEAETGATVIHMTPRLDAGPCLAQVATPIGADETAEALEPRLSRLGVPAVLDSIRKLAEHDGESPLGEIQDPSLATKAPRLKKQDGLVDWSRTARQVRDQVRALKPWPGTYTELATSRGQPLRLILDVVEVADPERQTDEPGTVVLSDGKQLHVATGGGVLAITHLKPAGKRVMEVAEFLRGHRIEAGTRLGIG
jgi:methionyl-tRNA formyltransferase